MGLFKRRQRPAGSAAPLDPRGGASFADEALPQIDAVYRFALRLCQGRGSEADDVVQQTYLRALKSWGTYRPGTDCRAWLFTICRNEFLKTVNRGNRRAETLTSEIDADVESLAVSALFSSVTYADPEQEFFDSFVDQEVIDTVDRLPDPFREALVLSDLEGMSYEQISGVLEVPVGTVKSRIFRARRLLQESLYDYALEMGYVRPKEKK